MTELEAIQAIYTRFIAGWGVLHPDIDGDPARVPFALDDEDYKPTDLGELGAWATVVIRHSTRNQATQGTPSSDECRGSVFVQLFGPKNEGTTKLLQLAEHVRTVLAKQRIGEVNMYAGRSAEATKKDAAWAMRVVVIPFRYRTAT